VDSNPNTWSISFRIIKHFGFQWCPSPGNNGTLVVFEVAKSFSVTGLRYLANMIMRKGLGTTTTATIATAAIIIASAMLMMTTTTTTTVYAQTQPEDMTATTTTTATNATTTTTAAPTNLEFEDEPFAESRFIPVSENVINETSQQVELVFEGTTTMTLPNTTETITTRDIGEGILTLIPGGSVLHGQVQLTTEDGSESALGLFTEYITTESTTAISLARFIANSTGVLAPLNNMIAVTLDQEQPDGSIIVRYFEWEESDDEEDEDDGETEEEEGEEEEGEEEGEE
jgi:hypothetical protein